MPLNSAFPLPSPYCPPESLIFNRQILLDHYRRSMERTYFFSLMKSAIRRAIILCLNGPGIFWHEDTAEAMLMIRSYSKARRWNERAKMACAAPSEALH